SLGRHEDALAIVQRATARSILEGLLVSERRDQAPARSIAAAGAWDQSMRRLAHALRSSPVAAKPDMKQLLEHLRGNHLITYFPARDDLWAIAVTANGSLRARKIESAAYVAERVAAWRDHLDDKASAEALGGLLLPDELMPPPDAPLYIVEDDPI